MGNLGRSLVATYVIPLVCCGVLQAQDATPTPKPALHVIGSISATDTSAQTITVKADKTGQEYTFTLADTKTLLKVPPGAKDLKTAARITAQDLQAADRVDVRYSADDANANPIPARSVLLMSARELAQARQAEQQAWQNSTAGTVTDVRATDRTLSVRVRSAQGPQVLAVHATPATSFTRYSPENPGTPAASGIAEIQPGDSVRIIGTRDGDTIEAQKVYSGSFKTMPAVVVSIDPENSGLVARDLQTKQTFHVAVTAGTMIRKLPPQMAMMIAQRVNARAAQAGGQAQGQGGGRYPQGGQSNAAPGAEGAGPRMGGDPAKMLEHMPPVALSDLKAGDAVVLSVAAGKDPTHFVASAIVAGVEPIFQSAPPRQGQQSFGGGDWGIDMNIPAQ